MSDTGSASNSPAKTPGSLASRIAAFESGSAANASKSSQQKAIPHADLSNLRSRFDREGEKPLTVKGSFGLGAAPVGDGRGSPKDRAVSLGSGRAVSPMQSPTVTLSTPTVARSASTTSSTAATRASSIGSSRPMSMRSDSTTSNSTTTSTSAVTATSTGSSLLPGPLAALMTSTSSPAQSSAGGAGDDASVSGLRTPMSSISLSSMQVETGSNAGDYPASAMSGEETANEEEGGIVTPGEEKGQEEVKGEEELQETEGKANAAGTQQESGNMDSAPLAEQAPIAAETKRPPQDAVDRAARELEDYTKEEPSTQAAAVAVPSPTFGSETDNEAIPTQSSSNGNKLPEVAISDVPLPLVATDTDTDKVTSPPFSPSLSTTASPSKRTSSSRPTSSSGLNLTGSSPKDRLRRSSTTNSINSVLSQPESDLADANLESYDNDAPAAAGEQVAESMAPLPHTSTGEKESDAPIQPVSPRPIAEATSANDGDRGAREDDLSQPSHLSQDGPVDVPTEENEEEDLDEDGMPKVKCSDCGDKVSLMKLGEHVCGPTSAPGGAGEENHGDVARRDPMDVPEDDVAFSSPIPQSRDLPQSQSDRDVNRLERPDVPDDAMSIGSIDPEQGMDNPTSAIPDVPTSVAQVTGLSNAGTSSGFEAGEEVDLEEDYMTALTSRRDAIDQQQQQQQRPGHRSQSVNSRGYDGGAVGNNEDDETEELALGMSDAPAMTPTFQTAGFAESTGISRGPGYPDSPTPDKEHLSPTTTFDSQQDTPKSSRVAPALAEQGAGVRRRSTGGGRKNKNLGDTDSEGDVEPGTATIIR